MSHRKDDKVHELESYRAAHGRPRTEPTEDVEGAAVVAFPRRHGDEDGSPHGPEQPVWRYDQRVRGSEHRFAGYVSYVGGDEGERVRAELATVLGELMRWAASQQDPDKPGDQQKGRAA